MGTKGNIIAQVDDEWRLIYVGYDSYLSSLGRMLFKHYQDVEKVEQLVSLGDCSYVGRELTPDLTTAYHRDRHEPWDEVQYQVFPSLEEALAATSESYIYARKDGKWWWDKRGDGLKELTEESEG